MDPFSLLTDAGANLGLDGKMTFALFGIVAGSIALTAINLMNGKPVQALKIAIGGSAFLAVLWSFANVSGALGVI